MLLPLFIQVLYYPVHYTTTCLVLNAPKELVGIYYKCEAVSLAEQLITDSKGISSSGGEPIQNEEK